jgi:hypothetical protein
MESIHHRLEEIATRLAARLDGSRLQGVLAGGLCAGVGPGRPTAAMLLGALELDDPADPDAQRELLLALEIVAEQLRDPELAFAPLLPQDDESLSLRALALGQWCDAFIEGFSACLGSSGEADLSEETREILGDIGAIAAGLDPESLASGEEDDERDFWQIAEFVRIAAISIFAERASPPPESLH